MIVNSVGSLFNARQSGKSDTQNKCILTVIEKAVIVIVVKADEKRLQLVIRDIPKGKLGTEASEI